MEKEIDISNNEDILVKKEDISPQLFSLLKKIEPLVAKQTGLSGEFKKEVFTSDGTWTKPTNVKEAFIFMIGAGGGSEGGFGGNGSFGSGGGGASYGVFSNLQGDLTVIVGQGVSGDDGEDSSVTDGLKTYIANGGIKGTANTAGAGGDPTNGDDFVNYQGGNGGNKYTIAGFPRGGNGGGGAGCGGDGSNATAATLGFGAGGIGFFGETLGGTSGGRGGYSDPTEVNPLNYGGGAYGKNNSFGGYAATTGANGLIIICWVE